MTTNGTITTEDTEMGEYDGDKVVTMLDVLQEEQDFEEDANAVLGASDDKNCSFNKGYIKRQAIYACMTCCSDAQIDPLKRAGVCLACSLTCHENHDLIELYTKRNFCCDCGNAKFNSHPCKFNPTKTELNEDNKYNQNYSGLYCTCHRPYPDPESTTEDEMIQCIICEDWLHASHLDAIVPDEPYSEMICKDCMEKNIFLHDYSSLAITTENVDVDIVNSSGAITVSNGIPDYEGTSANTKEQDVEMKNETDLNLSVPTCTKGSQAESVINLASDAMKDFTNEPEKVESEDISKENKSNTMPGTEEKQNSLIETVESKIEKDQLAEDKASENTTVNVDQNKIECGTNLSDSKDLSNSEEIIKDDTKNVTKEENETPTPQDKDVTTAGIADSANDSPITDVNESNDVTDNDLKMEEELLREPSDTEERREEINTEILKSNIESDKEPVTITTNEAAMDTTKEPVMEMASDVVIDTTNAPAMDTSNEPTMATTSDSAGGAANKVAMDATNDEVMNTTNEPAMDTTNEPPMATTSDPAIETANKVVMDTTSEPAIDTTNEPLTATTSDSGIETAIKVVMDTTNEPAIDTTNEPLTATTSDSGIETAIKVVMDTTNEPVLNMTNKPAMDTTIEPSVDPPNEAIMDTTNVEATDTSTDPVAVTDNIPAINTSNDEDQKQGTEVDGEKKESVTSNTELQQTGQDNAEASSEQNSNLASIDTVKPDTDSIIEDETLSKHDSTKIGNDCTMHGETTSVIDQPNIEVVDETIASSSENKRKLSMEEDKEDGAKRIKPNGSKCCIRPSGIKRHLKGATFWPSNFRQKLCTCNECMSMYKDLSVLFLIDSEDTVAAYETLGKERSNGNSQYEKGLQALSSLDRIQQINAVTEYNKLREKLSDFLKSFMLKKEIVKEEDIKAFFAGMKPKREPDGVYFCR